MQRRWRDGDICELGSNCESGLITGFWTLFITTGRWCSCTARLHLRSSEQPLSEQHCLRRCRICVIEA
ncbi:hypothetical protein KC19_4G070600 [Ceratodon purpureus]|uniref:Uncharacterized protein n=1 Tax=Ceratodon purpureus TaxID=3225 RepID=A0A8T0I8P0_CERPU|nr:hypothetical protein KC19_4G070600 [Ceratodon purpureus]